MKRILVAVALVMVSLPATTQTKCEVTSTNPICKLPQLGTSMASQGYVSAHGTWTPDGLINNADIEIECIQASIPQVSDSTIGACQMASAIIFQGVPAVALNDFGIVAVDAKGTHWLLESKGAETGEVPHKDAAAEQWCESATVLTGTKWTYLKVQQKSFETLQPTRLEHLEALRPAPRLFDNNRR